MSRRELLVMCGIVAAGIAALMSRAASDERRRPCVKMAISGDRLIGVAAGFAAASWVTVGSDVRGGVVPIAV